MPLNNFLKGIYIGRWFAIRLFGPPMWAETTLADLKVSGKIPDSN